MGAPRWLDDGEQRTWRAFIGATRLVFEELDRELQRDAGMPHTYYVILAMLSESPEHTLRMGDLAQAAGCSPSRLSHAVARLEEAGWVHRIRCAGDRRGAEAVLTDAGLTALVSAAPGHVDGVRRHLFDRLTDEQVDQLRSISEAVLGGRAHGIGPARRRA